MSVAKSEISEASPPSLRLMLIIEEVAKAGVPVTPTEVNAKLGLPKPTIHRLFATLENEGFLQREIDGRSFTAGSRLRTMSTNVLSSLRVRTARLAVLKALAEEIGETCNLAIPDRDAMVYLDRVETKWPLRIQLPVGTHVPFYCTASGKMYLSTLNAAHLDTYLNAITLAPQTPKTITDKQQLRDEIAKIARQGYSRDDEEFMESMIALAVAINDNQGRLMSTLSFHAPVQRVTLKDGLSFLPALKKAANELSKLVVEDHQLTD